MRLTELSSVVLRLASRLAMYADSIYAEQYDRDLVEMRADLLVVGVEQTTIPDSAKQFQDEPFGVAIAIIRALQTKRSQLGSDVFALPLFIFHYMSYRAVKHSALGVPFDDERKWLSAALSDLNLETEEDRVDELIRKETLWIKSTSQNGVEVRAEDVARAWARISTRIVSLWREAERRYWQDQPVVGINDAPEYSCFISYSFADEEFCNRLWDRLWLAGVQVWFASHDMKGGKKVRTQVTDAIGTYDKLLLVLSEASLKSTWVDHELYTAFRREKRENTQVLFPIRIVPFDALRDWEAFDADSGRDLAREVREYFIPDFSEWKDDEKFEKAFSQLLDSLRREETNKDETKRENTKNG